MLLLDIESGSVGSALLRLSPQEQPKLFGESRVHLPVAMVRSGQKLTEAVVSALRTVLQNTADLAARIRLHPKTSAVGEVAQVAVFMAPPWGRPNLADGLPEFMPAMQEEMRRAAAPVFGSLPVSFYTAAGAAAFGNRALFGTEPCLVYHVTGESSELMLMDTEGVRAHATIPMGSHVLLRTLRTHGGLSEHEARSAARLPFAAPLVREPFAAAAAPLSEQVGDTMRAFTAAEPLSRVRVIAAEPAGEWFARAIASNESFAEYFPQGGEVRALRKEHLVPHIAAHAASPDLPLMLQALFVDSQINP